MVSKDPASNTVGWVRFLGRVWDFNLFPEAGFVSFVFCYMLPLGDSLTFFWPLIHRRPLSTVRVHITQFVQASDPYGCWPKILVGISPTFQGVKNKQKKNKRMKRKKKKWGKRGRKNNEENEEQNEEEETQKNIINLYMVFNSLSVLDFRL